MSRLLKIALLGAASAMTLASPALAQSGDSGRWNLSAGVGSDNRSKDASKSGNDPFVYGEALWEDSTGFFYAGPAFETIDSGGSSLEAEIGGGIRPQWAGFDFNLNATHKWRLGANSGYDDDAWEFTADMSRSIGPASARLRLQHSPDGAGSVKDWTWTSLRGGWDFTDKFQVSSEIGYRSQDNAPDYTGWNIGGTYRLTKKIDVDVRYHDTDASELDKQYGSAVVATLNFSY